MIQFWSVLSLRFWWPKRINWPRVHSWLRHCGMCAREETVTKYNRRTDPLPRVFRSFGLCRKGWPRVLRAGAAEQRGPFFPESLHRHARTGNRPPRVALSFFFRPRDISGRALVTGYPQTSREANFWQSSTAPCRARVNWRASEVVEPSDH